MSESLNDDDEIEENVCVCNSNESLHQSLMEHENSGKQREREREMSTAAVVAARKNWCACSRVLKFKQNMMD